MIMKRLTYALLLFAVMIFASAFPQKGKAETARRDEAIVEFPETVKLLGVLLKGEYLMVHDEEKMAQGFPCFYIYTVKNGKQDALVTSFHCLHIDREKADKFLVTTSNRRSPFDVREIREIQFAGSADGHGVPR
jgi:hypothetical protein